MTHYSLQATWIRNTILRAVRQTDTSAAKRLPPNIVFKAPTISGLARIVYATVNNDEVLDDASLSPQSLLTFVEKYSADFPERPATLIDRPASSKEVILITGTTGGFGCDALEHLLRDENVERVYAFNRKGSKALERQHAQFQARGLDEKLLDTPKFKLVEVALHEPGFDVEPGLLDEIRSSVTHILHNGESPVDRRKGVRLVTDYCVRSLEGGLQYVHPLVPARHQGRAEPHRSCH